MAKGYKTGGRQIGTLKQKNSKSSQVFSQKEKASIHRWHTKYNSVFL